MAGNSTVSATSGGAPFATRIEAGGLTARSDAHTESGGGGTALSPLELFVGSLCACMAITARIYAKRKGLGLESIDVRALPTRAPGGAFTKIELEVELVGDLSPEDRQRVFEITRSCPIHRTLEGRVEMPMRLAGA